MREVAQEDFLFDPFDESKNEDKEEVNEHEIVQEKQKEPSIEEEKKEEIQTDEAIIEAETLNQEHNNEELKIEALVKEEILEEASEYDEDIFQDFRFLESEEKSLKGEIEDAESNISEENKDSSIAGDLEEDLSPTKSEKNKKEEITEFTTEVVSLFRFNEEVLLDTCKLFFYINNITDTNPIDSIKALLKDGFCRNPANVLKVLDTILFTLYSPEVILENIEAEGIKYPPKKLFENKKQSTQDYYLATAANMISFIAEFLRDQEKSFILFTPLRYLEKYGNSLLNKLKEKTNFYQKTRDNFSIFDALIGVLELKLISQSQSCVKPFIKALHVFLSQKNKLVLREGDSQAISSERFKQYFSQKNISILFSFFINNSGEAKSIINDLEKLFSQLKNHPDFFISLQDHLAHHFVQLERSVNHTLNDNIKLLKNLSPEKVTKEDLRNVTSALKINHLSVLSVLFKTFVSVFYHHLFTTAKNNLKVSDKIFSFLKMINQNILNEGDIQRLLIHIHEILDLIHKTKNNLKISQNEVDDSIKELILICINHYALIVMLSSADHNGSNKGGSNKGSLSELDQMPKLSKMVSCDESEAELSTSLQRTFSHYKSQIEVDFQPIFANFALKYSSVISNIRTEHLKQEGSIINDILLLLIPKCPWIFDFKTKKQILNDKILAHINKYDINDEFDRRSVEVRRDKLILSAIEAFKNLSKKDLLLNINLRYKNEPGIDAGGLRREFFHLLAKELFDPQFGLFRLAENKLSIQPNPFASIVPNYLFYLEFAGIMVAKCIADPDTLIDLSFTKSFLKHIQGKKIAISDLEDVDADLAKNLRWILENEVEDLDLVFTHETEILGERVTLELLEGGFDTVLTEANKKDYVKKVCEERMTKEIENPIKAFLKGFRAVLPKEFLSHLSTSELEILIAGASTIDLGEMKKHACYYVYSASSQIVKWFWEILEEFKQEDLAAFLFFVSGSMKVPYGGFEANPVTITKCSKKDSLPIGHTCSYEIEIPEYETKEILREKILVAIFEGVDGFYIG